MYGTVSVTVSDAAYGTAWDGVGTLAPSQNAIYDRFAAIGTAAVSDAAYGTAWAAVTDIAPSKKAMYDKVETLGASTVSDAVYGTAWAVVTTIAPSKKAVYDKLETFGTAQISNDVYGAGWDGVNDVAPSKNAVYDKIQTIAAGAGVRSNTLIVAGFDASANVIAQSDYQCDGTSDAVQINAAITALPTRESMCTVKLIGHFHPEATITLVNYTRLDLTEASLDWDVHDNLFEATGTTSTSTVLTSNVVAGDTHVHVTSATGFAVGDYVIVRHDACIVGTAGGGGNNSLGDAEIHRIRTIDGTTIYLDSEMWLAYNTTDTATLQKINMVHDVEIIGGYINGASAVQTEVIRIGSFLYMARFKIEGMYGEEICRCGWEFYSCVAGVVAHNHLWGAAYDGYGYGVNIEAACNNLRIHHNDFTFCRHAYTGGSSPSYYGSPMYITFDHNYCVGEYDASSGSQMIDIHGCGAMGIKFDDNIVIGNYSSRGFSVGAYEWSATGNIVSVADMAFADYRYNDVDPHCGQYVTLRNNTVLRGSGIELVSDVSIRVVIDGLILHAPVSEGVYVAPAASTGTFAKVSNVISRVAPTTGTFYGICVNNVNEVQITDNNIRNTPNDGIYIGGAVKGLVANNTVSNSAATCCGIYLYNASYLHVHGNTCFDDQGGSATQKYGIEEGGTANNNRIINNYCWGNVTKNYLILGAATLLVEPEAKGLTFWNTVDSALVADRVSVGGFDLSAGNRALAVSQEAPVVAIGTAAHTHKWPVRINGVTYYAVLTTGAD